MENTETCQLHENVATLKVNAQPMRVLEMKACRGVSLGDTSPRVKGGRKRRGKESKGWK